MDGSGVYSSLNDCEQECTDVSSINENIINVNIFPIPSSNIFNLEFNSDSETETLVTSEPMLVWQKIITTFSMHQ